MLFLESVGETNWLNRRLPVFKLRILLNFFKSTTAGFFPESVCSIVFIFYTFVCCCLVKIHRNIYTKKKRKIDWKKTLKWI